MWKRDGNNGVLSWQPCAEYQPTLTIGRMLMVLPVWLKIRITKDPATGTVSWDLYLSAPNSDIFGDGGGCEVEGKRVVVRKLWELAKEAAKRDSLIVERPTAPGDPVVYAPSQEFVEYLVNAIMEQKLRVINPVPAERSLIVESVANFYPWRSVANDFD
jgi:hypothetical protein